MIAEREPTTARNILAAAAAIAIAVGGGFGAAFADGAMENSQRLANVHAYETADDPKVKARLQRSFWSSPDPETEKKHATAAHDRDVIVARVGLGVAALGVVGLGITAAAFRRRETPPPAAVPEPPTA